MAIVSIKWASLLDPNKQPSLQDATGAAPVVPTPTFTSATTSSYTAAITGFDAQFTYTVSASAGSAVRTDGNVTVSGLSANQSSTLTVTAANTARELSFSSAVAFLSLPATPTLSRSGGTTTTVTVAIGNYDAGLTYTVGASAGSATRSGNTITVTGLTEGQAVTVTATASNASGSSTQGSLATGAMPSTPTISFASATINSLTFTITNHNVAYSYSVSASAGSASRSGNTITVTGLAAGTTYTVSATATANGVNSAQGTQTGTTASPPISTNLVFWLDAEDASSFSYSSGTLVSEWRDLSGNNNHFSQSTTTVQPSRSGTIGTKTAVVFDNTDDTLTRSSTPSALIGSNSRSFYLVLKLNKTTAQNWLIYGPNLDHQLWQLCSPFWTSSQYTLHTYNSGIGSGFAVETTFPIIISAHYNSSSTVATIRRNTSSWTNTRALNTAGNSTTNAPIAIGAGVPGVHGYVGAANASFGEILAYSVDHTNSERTTILNYLASKWGVTL